MKVLVINGPNLNLLGSRQTEIYGKKTLDGITRSVRKAYPKAHFHFFQSNSEGEIIDEIHTAVEGDYTGVIINPGAYSHYSYAIRDALSALKVPVIEVHLSNIHKREEFRQKSVISAVCTGVVSGFGETSYILAVQALMDMMRKR
ncbi:MAG: type II 3-dehydroquinate dehydratase [Bacteroidota bacterium]